MTEKEKNKIKYRMRRLARKFCRRNNVYESFDSSVAELIEKAYFSAYLFCLHENKNRIVELEKESDFYHAEKGNYKCAFLKEVLEKNKINKQLTKAKELLKNIIDTPMYNQMGGEAYENEEYKELIEEAEQFLKDLEK